MNETQKDDETTINIDHRRLQSELLGPHRVEGLRFDAGRADVARRDQVESGLVSTLLEALGELHQPLLLAACLVFVVRGTRAARVDHVIPHPAARHDTQHAVGIAVSCRKKEKVCLYRAGSSPLSTLHTGRPVHSDINSTSLRSIIAMQLNTREDYSPIFPPPSIARYSFKQLSELGHHGENENAQT